MEEEQYYNSDSVVHKPRFIHGGGRVVILRVDGVGGADRTSVINSSLVVRLRAAALILGEQSSMLFNISEVSGASLSISLDMRSMLNNMIYLDIWGLGPHVQEAERLIFNLLRQPYNGPCVLPMSYNYIYHDSIILPIDKATHLFKYSIMKVETKTYTWIDVHASPWKLGAAQDDVELHFYGASMKNINSAVDLVKKVVSEAGEGGTTMKKAQMCGLFGKLLWITTKDSSRCLGKGMNCVFKELWKGAKQSSRLLGQGINSLFKSKICETKTLGKSNSNKKNGTSIKSKNYETNTSGSSSILLPRGFLNPGNLCFMSATLQALLGCSPFIDLVQLLRTHTIPKIKFPTLHAFVALLCEFDTPGPHSKGKNDTGEAFLPVMFETILNQFTPDMQNSFSGKRRERQECAAEFLTFIMGKLDVELVEFDKGKRGVSLSAKFNEIFGGEVLNCLTKGKEDSSRIVFHRFLLLHLNIWPPDIMCLEDALDRYCAIEDLDQPAGAAKYFKLAKLPEILTIQLVRYTNKLTKIVKQVRFHRKMTISADLFADPESVPKEERLYKLVAVITHIGEEIKTGHYTADVLRPSGEWLQFEDGIVSQVTEDEVLGRQAYLLFYQRQ